MSVDTHCFKIIVRYAGNWGVELYDSAIIEDTTKIPVVYFRQDPNSQNITTHNIGYLTKLDDEKFRVEIEKPKYSFIKTPIQSGIIELPKNGVPFIWYYGIEPISLGSLHELVKNNLLRAFNTTSRFELYPILKNPNLFEVIWSEDELNVSRHTWGDISRILNKYISHKLGVLTSDKYRFVTQVVSIHKLDDGTVEEKEFTDKDVKWSIIDSKFLKDGADNPDYDPAHEYGYLLHERYRKESNVTMIIKNGSKLVTHVGHTNEIVSPHNMDDIFNPYINALLEIINESDISEG